MITKFGAVCAVAAIIIAAGLHPADARGTMPSLHDGWNRTHAEVLPASYAPAPQPDTLRRALAQKRHLRD